MTRGLISAVLAAALAFTPLAAAPARADAEDVAKVVVGIAALAILSDALKKGGNRSTATVSSGTTYYGNDRWDRDWERDWDRDWRRDDRDSRRDFRGLPQECLFTYDTRRGPVRAYSEHCLKKRMRHVNRLPDHCETRLRTTRGLRDVYLARCLRHEGWTVEARDRRR